MDKRFVDVINDLKHCWLQWEASEAGRQGVLERLENLSMLVAYQGFDLEATRRENKALREHIAKGHPRRR